MATRILIADDDVTIRLLLRRLLEQQPGWQVCGDASTGAEAIAKVEQLNPDVVVMDLSMPVMTGLQAAPAIARAHPRLPMLLISVQEVSRQLAWEARNAGYRGAVTKNSGNEVLRGVEALLRKETFLLGGRRLTNFSRVGPVKELRQSIAGRAGIYLAATHLCQFDQPTGRPGNSSKVRGQRTCAFPEASLWLRWFCWLHSRPALRSKTLKSSKRRLPRLPPN